MIHDERIHKETSSEDQDYDWMYGFHVKKTFPPEIAAGWIAALKNGADKFIPDPLLPDNEDAAMYKIFKKWTMKNRREGETHRRSYLLSAQAA